MKIIKHKLSETAQQSYHGKYRNISEILDSNSFKLWFRGHQECWGFETMASHTLQ